MRPCASNVRHNRKRATGRKPNVDQGVNYLSRFLKQENIINELKKQNENLLTGMNTLTGIVKDIKSMDEPSPPTKYRIIEEK